jgi:hypothetical protein
MEDAEQEACDTPDGKRRQMARDKPDGSGRGHEFDPLDSCQPLPALPTGKTPKNPETEWGKIP